MQAIENLRSKMQTAGIEACIIPQNDPHASAYIAEHWQALQYFSGFTGSAGTLVVLPREAGLWTDSRYFLQADEELAGTDICLFRSGEKDVPTIYDFLVEKLPENSLVSMNGLLFSVSEIECAEAVFNRKNIRIDIQTDLITQAWDNRPPMPFSNIFIHNIKYAGKTTGEKIQTVRQQIQENNCCALVLNTPEEIAWLLNLRAADVKHNPVFIAYLVITSNESILFVDKNKLNEEVKIYLQANGIRVENYQAIIEKTASVLGKGKTWIDPEAMNYALYKGIKTETFRAPSPVILLKSIKNETEIAGIHRAMIKDGVALTQFWQWLEIALAVDEKPTELSLAEKLRSLRAEQEDFFDESFASIVAYGKHGAIVHFAPNQSHQTHIRFCRVF